MSGPNRAKLIAKLHSALKKNYEAPPAVPSRPLLEHAMYACLLEDCPFDLAEEGLVKLEQDYFDWNEVRVTTASELKTVLGRLPDPQKAAQRLKTILQAIFEEFYSFDLDHLKKENLGKAVSKFENLAGMTPFVLSYVVQHGLGGHSIPLDYSGMVVMLVTGIASQNEAAGGRVPGLERAVPKTKGIEFSYLLHQPAVALTVDPNDKKARQTLESVVKGSAAALDEYLTSKAAAKERVAARKAEEREVAKQEAVEARAEAVAKAAEAPPKASVPKKPAKKPMSAAQQAAETAEKSARAKKAAARKSTKKTAPMAKTESDDGGSTPDDKPVEGKPGVAKTAEAKVAGSKTSEPREAASAATTKQSTKSKKTTKPTAGSEASRSGAPAKKPAVTSAKPKPESAAKPKTAKKSAPSAAGDSKKKSKTGSRAAAKTSSSKKAINHKLTKSKPR